MRSRQVDRMAKQQADRLMEQAYAAGAVALEAIKANAGKDEIKRIVAAIDNGRRGDYPDYSCFDELRTVAGRIGVLEHVDRCLSLAKQVDRLWGLAKR